MGTPSTAAPPTLLERLAASDPGSVRLALALRAAVGLVVVLALGASAAGAVGFTGQARTVVLILGAVLTMMTTFTASAATVRERLATQLSLPFAMAAGIVLAMLVDAHRLLSFATFVAVMFLAVWVRRFGPRFFAMGMVGWIGYFITLFLRLSFAVLPAVLLGLAAATVALALVTAFVPMRPALRLRRMAGSLRARVRIARHLHLRSHTTGAELDVGRSLLRVDETAVLLDGQSAVPGALPDTASAVRLRAAVLRVELTLAAMLESSDGGAGDRDLDRALERFDAEVAGRGGAAAVSTAAVSTAAVPTAAVPTATTPAFTPAAELFGGFLPASLLTVATLSDDAATRSGRLLPATRGALQIAVAGALCIGLGDLLSGQRWYWAVLACFLAYTGTATAGETVTKALQRTVGTVVGVAVALVVVPVLGASVPVALAVMLVSLFLGFYLFRVSYTALALFVTVIVAELYQLMGAFSGPLLALRIGETALGAVIGGVVAVVVLPLPARCAESAAHARLAEALQHALDGVVQVLHAGAPHRYDTAAVHELHARTRAVDAAVQQLALVGVPLAVRRPGRATERTAVARRLENWVGAAVRVRAVVHAIEDGSLDTTRGRGGPDLVETARHVRSVVHALVAGDDPGLLGLRASGERGSLLGRELVALHGVVVALHGLDPDVPDPGVPDPGVPVPGVPDPGPRAGQLPGRDAGAGSRAACRPRRRPRVGPGGPGARRGPRPAGRDRDREPRPNHPGRGLD